MEFRQLEYYVPVAPVTTWQLCLATAADRRLSPAAAALGDTLTGATSAVRS
jgi:hypothetical protein